MEISMSAISHVYAWSKIYSLTKWWGLDLILPYLQVKHVFNQLEFVDKFNFGSSTSKEGYYYYDCFCRFDSDHLGLRTLKKFRRKVMTSCFTYQQYWHFSNLTLDSYLLTLESWILTLYSWLLTFKKFLLTLESWLLPLDSWHLTFDSWILTFYSWLLTLDSWLLTLDSWLLTLEVWRLTPNSLTLDSWRPGSNKAPNIAEK